MKIFKLLFISCLIFLSTIKSYSNTFYYLWGGMGVSNHNNYDFGASAGLYYYKAVSSRCAIGFQGFIQEYNLERSESFNAVSGGVLKYRFSYDILAPSLTVQLNRSGNLHGYFSLGVGYLQTSQGFLHQWNNVLFPIGSYYNTVIFENDDLKQFIFRIGIGFTEYYKLFGKVHLTITEDVGIIPGTMEKPSESEDDYSNFKGNMHQFFSPTYFSIRAGFSLIKSKKNSGCGPAIRK